MAESVINKIQDIIGTDIGNRGMKSLICPGDLYQASLILSNLASANKKNSSTSSSIIILSGFPCCVNENPPTETDGPPGTFAIARACVALGYSDVIVVTDECNEKVFAACLQDLALPISNASKGVTVRPSPVQLQSFPANMTDHDNERLAILDKDCVLYIACERPGPGKDGVCYTMRGIDMNVKGLIAPLEKLVIREQYRNDDDDAQQQHQQQQQSQIVVAERRLRRAPFIAIGDGGNELGMGKVIDKIIDNPSIPNGDKIGCVVPADYLIAACVSNWGGYALAAGAAVCRAVAQESSSSSIKYWVDKCLPTDDEEVAMLNRCVAAGGRDGVTGKMEATVDGLSLETSLQCLRDIRAAALAAW